MMNNSIPLNVDEESASQAESGVAVANDSRRSHSYCQTKCLFGRPFTVYMRDSERKFSGGNLQTVVE